MAITLTKGTTVDIVTTVTAGTLHTLIESALVSGISASDFAADTHSIFVGTSAPNPSVFPLWYSSDPVDPVLRVFATPFDIWLAVGPDRFEIPLKNSGDATAPLGALVCSTSASTFFVATSPSLNAIGFLQATTAAAAWGPVATCGIGFALHISSVSAGASTNIPTTGGGIKAYGSPAGGCYNEGIGSGGGTGPFFGMWLEGNRSGASGSNSAFRALIWGPKITVAPI